MYILTKEVYQLLQVSRCRGDGSFDIRKHGTKLFQLSDSNSGYFFSISFIFSSITIGDRTGPKGGGEHITRSTSFTFICSMLGEISIIIKIAIRNPYKVQFICRGKTHQEING